QTDFELQVKNEEINQSEIDEIIENAGLFGKCVKSLNIISGLITKLGNDTSNQRIKIDRCANQGLTEFDKKVTRAVKVYSESINSITYKLNIEIEKFSFYFAESFSAQEKISILVYYVEQDYITLQELLDSLIQLKPNMNASIESMKFLRNSVSALPTKYAHLKKARLKFLEVSNQIIKEFKLADKMNDSFIQSLNEKLG
ncbi:unnamed protein product, partial [Ectocarpus sp. 12 AP-2014]